MSKIPIDPALTEHSSLEEAQAYDAWFRAEVQASLDEDAPSVPHDEAVAEMREYIEQRKQARNAR
ncbi:antitoxin [Caballeronia sp. SBC2]|uniref:type II toxin-antitoxin system RelB family antitoxin n=1 Tax=Caballeronia sp. SBC2 TaxID=2705547 RepID=UPI0013E13943|nr:antitoxin [Caballeronia sp. SBC2]QIE22605.1 hypothetical protein SBC2_06150 [Caballeronia sp. SBC2]